MKADLRRLKTWLGGPCGPSIPPSPLALLKCTCTHCWDGCRHGACEPSCFCQCQAGCLGVKREQEHSLRGSTPRDIVPLTALTRLCELGAVVQQVVHGLGGREGRMASEGERDTGEGEQRPERMWAARQGKKARGRTGSGIVIAEERGRAARREGRRSHAEAKAGLTFTKPLRAER